LPLQVYSYTAFGELLAIHDHTGAFVSDSEVDALTNLLYSGEPFDTRLGWQYLRARWYSPDTGRFERLDPFSGDPTSPLSFNKYAYTSGDPISFADPTGMFEGLIGLIGSLGIGNNARAKDAGASAKALHTARQLERLIDWAQTIVDIAVTAKDLASGDIIGIVKKLIDIDAGEIREIVTTLAGDGLTDLGLTALAAGPPIYVKIDMPKGGRGKLGKALRFVTNILGKSNGVQELIGEMGAWMMARLMKFRNADLPEFPKVHGPDIFARHEQSSVWAMIEAKGGTSRLSKGAKYGDQMQWKWIRHWYEWLADKNNNKSNDGDDLHNDYHSPFPSNANPIVAMVVSLNLRRRKDHLKIGVQSWTNNETPWNNWPSTGPNRF